MASSDTVNDAGWGALVRRVEAWDGSIEVGRALRGEVMGAVWPQGEMTGLAGALRSMVRYAQRGRFDLKTGTVTLGGLRGIIGTVGVDPHVLRLLACDEAFGWPWSDRTACVRNLCQLATLKRPDDPSPDVGWLVARELARAAAAVASLPGPVGERARDWLWTAFSLRERDLWLPHAAGLSLVFSPERDAALLGDDKGPEGHHRPPPDRRRNVLAALVALRLGAFERVRADAWATRAKDHQDLSAMAGGLVEFSMVSDGALRWSSLDLAARVLGVVAKQGLPQSYHAWETARGVVEGLGDDTPDAVWSLLCDGPVTHQHVGDRAVGALFDAGLTLRWLARFDEPRRGRLRERVLGGRLSGAPGVAVACELSAARWFERLRDTLARVAPHRWSATLPLERHAALAELSWLLLEPSAARLDWPEVVAAAGAEWLEATPGALGVAGWLDLTRLAASRHVAFSYLLQRITASTDADAAEREITELLRHRWVARGGDREGQRRWGVDVHVSNTLALRVARRLVALSTTDERGRALLHMLSADGPRAESRALVDGTHDNGLWCEAVKWLPATEGALAEALGPLVRVEAKGAVAVDSIASLVAHWGEAWAEVGAAFPDVARAGEQLERTAKRALAVLEAAPHEVGGRFMLGQGRGKRPASPRETCAWGKNELGALAGELIAARAELLLGPSRGDPPPPSGRPSLAGSAGATTLPPALTRIGEIEAMPVELPLLSDGDAVIWGEALAALRGLAQPMPMHVRAVVDALCSRVERWVANAVENDALRRRILDELRSARRDGDERAVVALVREHHALLGHAALREAGVFLLKRLSFDRAARVRALSPSVPRPMSHYAPLLFGVLGGPLSNMQADKIWTPLLRSVSTNPASVPYHLVVWTLLLICAYMLWADVRRDAPDLRPAKLARRAAGPFVVLLVLNYALNAFVWWVAPQGAEIDPAGVVPTVLLWGHLSLFTGVFLGMIAQGRRTAED